MDGFVVYCTQRKLFYRGSQQFGEKPKFYQQRNHASNAINNCYSYNKDTLKICPARVTIELPEE